MVYLSIYFQDYKLFKIQQLELLQLLRNLIVWTPILKKKALLASCPSLYIIQFLQLTFLKDILKRILLKKLLTPFSFIRW